MRRFPHRSFTLAPAMAVAVCLGALAGCTGAPPAGPVLPADWPSTMLAELNSARAGANLAPLSTCAALSRSAQTQSNGQATMGKLSHTGVDKSTLEQRVARSGYGGWTTVGENVGSGYSTVDAVMAAWMGDQPHRANLLGAGYTSVGFGEAVGPGGIAYWTQDFGSGGAC